MADTAAWLVDDVIPNVPVRQWVLSVPFKVRFALARDARLLTKALGIFIREVFRDLRRRTGTVRGDCGAVTGVQRFGGSLNLNVHFHAVVLDGVYREGRFKPAPRPKQADLDAMVVRVRRKIQGMLRREGVRLDDEDDGITEPLDLFQAASIQRRVATSPDARSVEVVGGEKGVAVKVRKKHLEAEEQGYSIHAAVRMKAGDRKGLEILARYVLRPSFAEERMTRLADGRIAYGFRRAWDDGSSHVILSPMELMAKLAALVPPPRYHLVRYHGVLAPNSKRRRAIVKAPASECDHVAAVTTAPPESTPATSQVVVTPPPACESRPPAPPPPTAPSPPAPRAMCPLEVPPDGPSEAAAIGTPGPIPPCPAPSKAAPDPSLSTPDDAMRPSPLVTPTEGPSRLPSLPHPRGGEGGPASVPRVARPAHMRRSWASLMLRSLLLDVLKCPRCPGRMKVIACIDQPEVIEKFLRAAGLWTEPATPVPRVSTAPRSFDGDSQADDAPGLHGDWVDDPPLD